MPRLLALATASLALAASSSLAAIDSVATRYMRTGDFQRLVEFFRLEEFTGDRLVLRTHAQERSGYYFILRITNDTPAGSSVEIEAIPEEQRRPETHRFTLPPEAAHQTVYLGLTAPNWALDTTRPLAWRLRLLGSDGQLLDERVSFLWSLATR